MEAQQREAEQLELEATKKREQLEARKKQEAVLQLQIQEEERRKEIEKTKKETARLASKAKRCLSKKEPDVDPPPTKQLLATTVVVPQATQEIRTAPVSSHEELVAAALSSRQEAVQEHYKAMDHHSDKQLEFVDRITAMVSLLVLLKSVFYIRCLY
jgi:hypothetical protein